MYRSFIVVLLFTASIHPLCAQDKVYRQLKNLELQRFEAMTRKDTTFLKEILSDELTFAHSNGYVEAKTTHLKNIGSSRIVYENIQPEELKIRTFKKTAVITGFIEVKGRYKQTPFDIRLRYLDVYIRKRGKWKLVAWQSVKVEK